MDTTREMIKHAAWNEFARHGFDGARMQRIADEASVNKAMIHYYFQNKANLFETIISEAFAKLFNSLKEVNFSDPSNIEQIVTELVETHLDFVSQHPLLIKMVQREFHSDSPIISRAIESIFQHDEMEQLFSIFSLFDHAKARGMIRATIDPRQFLWNLLGCNLFTFFARPVLEAVWGPVEDEQVFLALRKKAIVDHLLYGVIPR
jgi:AcrR family transcriptional regulator